MLTQKKDCMFIALLQKVHLGTCQTNSKSHAYPPLLHIDMTKRDPEGWGRGQGQPSRVQ